MGFEYHQPVTTDEALQMADRWPDARFVAGGTDLMVQMRQDHAWPPALISLRRVEELAQIEEGTSLRIGAAVPVRRLAAHPTVVSQYPALVESIRVFGSPQIRNVATIGGNLCNASPGADCAPPLLVYQAQVELRHGAGIRHLPIEDFLQGPGVTALESNEIMTAILLDPPAAGTRSTFVRKGRVQMDLAIASVAALVEMDGSNCTSARIAAGAVAPVPCRLKHTEAIIRNSDLGAEVRARARAEAESEVAPISDLRASEEYRRRLTGVFVERSLAVLATDLATGGDET